MPKGWKVTALLSLPLNLSERLFHFRAYFSSSFPAHSSLSFKLPPMFNMRQDFSVCSRGERNTHGSLDFYGYSVVPQCFWRIYQPSNERQNHRVTVSTENKTIYKYITVVVVYSCIWTQYWKENKRPVEWLHLTNTSLCKRLFLIHQFYLRRICLIKVT